MINSTDKTRILVIALSGIGDALMFTPSLIKLKEDFPHSEIDALVMFGGVKDIYQTLPQINNIHHFDFLKKSKAEALKFVLSLRGKYDISINVYPSNRKEYNLISFLIGAPKRSAVQYLRKDFINLGFLNNYRILENDNFHNVDENILMCEKLSGKKSFGIQPLQFNFSETSKLYQEKFLSANGISNDDLVIGFHPGCSALKNHDKRRWSTKNFAELAKLLIKNKNAKILIFGGKEELYLKQEIISYAANKNIIGVETSSLEETASVMKRCNLFITNDSSLMHVASALQLNVIALIGPTNPKYISPWQTKHSIISLNLECAPCFYYSPKPLSCARKDVQFKCIVELPFQLVYDEALKYLGNYK